MHQYRPGSGNCRDVKGHRAEGKQDGRILLSGAA